MGSFGWPFRIASAAMGLLFFFAVIVQYNDPDPIAWMILYGAAAVLSLAAAIRPLGPKAPGIVAAIAFLWSASLAPVVLTGRTSFAEMFRTYEMMSPQMEEGREMLGLALTAAWMAALAVRGHLRRRAGATPARATADAAGS